MHTSRARRGLLPALFFLGALMPVGASQEARSAQRPPNVVLIMADDLGYGELGCYGQEKIRTPHIDALAAGGMRFTRHYSGSPVCAPSRCVLLTGYHTGHSYVRGNWEGGGWGPDAKEGQLPLAAEVITIPELLKPLGYATGAMGKWGLGGPGSTGHPLFQGFDRFYGLLCQRVAHNYYPTHLWDDHDVDVLGGNDYFKAHQRLKEEPAGADAYARFSGAIYAPDRMIEEALEFVTEHAAEPFFLYYPSPVPHVALQVPQDSLAEYAESFDDKPYLGQKGYLPHPKPRAAYAAMVTRMDRDIGALLGRLDELGLTGNTIVFFTSDNGPTFNGGSDSAYFNSAPQMRGLKCSVYEGGIRIPLIARWPGRIAAGSVSEHLSAFQDMLPTVMDLTGGTTPAGIDGISFAPTLLARGAQAQHEYLYFEYPEAGKQQALRTERWKAVRQKLGQGRLHVELYDLLADPQETTDVGADNPAVLARMTRWMFEARVPNENFPIKALDEMHGR